MNARTLAIGLLIPFSLLTAYALYSVGFIGVFRHQASNPGGWQVFVDLAIALTLILCWLVPNAKKTGRNPWPYVIVTLIAGSFGPLFYLLFSNSTPDTSSNTDV